MTPLAEARVISAPLRAMTSDEVRRLRLLAGWTQAQMGDLLGMGKRSYSRRENGLLNFRPPEVLMLMLWWRNLRARGLKFHLEDDPERPQWYVLGELNAKRWRALGPFETRREANEVLNWLNREGL